MQHLHYNFLNVIHRFDHILLYLMRKLDYALCACLIDWNDLTKGQMFCRRSFDIHNSMEILLQ